MAFEPKVGAVCAARFSQDNEWYRAKVTKRDKGRLPAPLLGHTHIAAAAARGDVLCDAR